MYVRAGSIFWLSPQAGDAPRCAEDLDTSVAGKYAAFHADLLARGIYFAPSAYEVGFLSLAHTPDMLKLAASEICEAMDHASGDVGA